MKDTRLRGLFIGLTTVDIQYFVEEFPKPNVKIKCEQPIICAGGPATNAAVAFSFLNGEAFLATPFGNNGFASLIREDFQKNNIVHFDLAENRPIEPVIASVITSENNGDRTIFTHNRGEFDSKLNVNQLFTKVNPDILLLDGFNPGISLQCAQMAKKRNIPVVIDAGSWKPGYADLLQLAAVVICSEDFFPPGCQSTADVEMYLQKCNIGKFAISRGNKSIIVVENGIRSAIEIKQANVKDTLGAGDFLHGAFCYYYLQLNNFENAVQKSSEFATNTCMFRGSRGWLNVEK